MSGIAKRRTPFTRSIYISKRVSNVSSSPHPSLSFTSDTCLGMTLSKKVVNPPLSTIPSELIYFLSRQSLTNEGNVRPSNRLPEVAESL